MNKLSVFNFISLNGYFKGENGDLSWHKHGEEENQFASDSMKPGGILLFGRITYEMMASYWPTPMALENDPEVAKGMNRAEKIVFSRTLKKADWNNTTIISGNIFDEVKRLKQSSGKDLSILGSGSIVSQLTEKGLIDEYLIMVDPVIINSGTPIFKGLNKNLELKLTDTRKFKSGVVLLSYVNGKK